MGWFGNLTSEKVLQNEVLCEKENEINFSVYLIGLPNWKYILSLIIMF